MSLHQSSRRVRGASMNEYALLLFLLIGGAAAAIKTTGLAVRDSFAASGEALGGGTAGETETTGLRLPDLRDGGKR